MTIAPIKVILAEYDPEWPKQADAFIAQLHAAVAHITTIHHIGSTAIPGIIAKPIIDLMPIVATVGELNLCQQGVESLGYSWHGEFGIPGRRYCKLEDGSGSRIAQLHIYEATSQHIERHLAFRDYLRARPDVARAHETEKRRAQALHPESSHAYSEEKSAWISEVQATALHWFNATTQSKKL